MNNLQIPEMVNDFNVYLNGTKMIGVTNEVSLAELKNLTETVNGAGVLGQYDAPAIGHFDAINQEIPFRTLIGRYASLLNTGMSVDLTLRGAIQVINRSTGATEYVGARLVYRGRSTSFKPGTMKQAAQMGASVTISSVYVLVVVDNVNLFELDKVNGVYRVNGTDLLAGIKALC